MKISGLIFKGAVKVMVVNIFLHLIPKFKVTFSSWGIVLKAYVTVCINFLRKGGNSSQLVIKKKNRSAFGATAILFLTLK